jgi:hypothetical protein
VADDAEKLIEVVPIRNLVIVPKDRILGGMMVVDPTRAGISMD